MENFKLQYRNLEQMVLSELSNKVRNSKRLSKHVEGNAIEVDVNGYVELVLIFGGLTFLDDSGYQYHWTQVSLEDLIDILQ
jgi:hypothetical protein